MRGNHDVWLHGTSENNHEDEKKLKTTLAGHIDTSHVRHYENYSIMNKEGICYSWIQNSKPFLFTLSQRASLFTLSLFIHPVTEEYVLRIEHGPENNITASEIHRYATLYQLKSDAYIQIQSCKQLYMHHDEHRGIRYMASSMVCAYDAMDGVKVQ